MPSQQHGEPLSKEQLQTLSREQLVALGFEVLSKIEQKWNAAIHKAHDTNKTVSVVS